VSLSEKLAAFAAGLSPADLPQAVIEDAKLRVLDSIGIMLAGATTANGRAMLEGASRLGQGREAGIVGFAARSTASLAALVNGTLAHAMDFDDTHNASVMHPSAVSVATALAVAEAEGSSGMDLLLGVALGNEIGCRLGLAAPGAFHDVGLHPTSVLGAPAAALVAGRLMGLSAQQLVWALGISASQGSGVLAAYSDGSWSKTLHPGWAAHCGIVAATLARAGFTGPASGLDGHYGLFASHIQKPGYAFDLKAATARLGRRWHGVETAFKLYPNAHAIHAFIEMALALRAEHGLRGGDIRKVMLHIPAGFEGQIAVPRSAKLVPRTTTHARHTVFYAVAAALQDGEVGMQHFTEASIARPDLLALTRLVHHEAVAMPEGVIRFGGGMEIVCRGGRRFSMAIEEADGTGSRRLGAERLEAKFRVAAGMRVSGRRVERIVRVCRGLDGMAGVGDLVRADK
jgi:2-methylcitrate dehydratase PrpD